MDNITLKEDGTLQGLDLESIKKSDGYLFDIEQTHIEGADGSSKKGFLSTANDLKAQIEKAMFS